MKPKLFVVQPIPDVALDILRSVADVRVYPYLDRQISTDELVINAMHSDWLFVLGDTIVPAEVINANPNSEGHRRSHPRGSEHRHGGSDCAQASRCHRRSR